MDEIILARLSPDGEQVVGEDPAEILELEPDEAVVSVGPVRYDLRVMPVVGDELLVQGKVRCEVVFRCCRCAEPFTLEVAEDPYVRSYELLDETESVDLTPDIREATLLAFPASPVCKPDCRGLCAKCGKDLNREPCTCSPEPDARWDVLEGLGGVE